jgi:hypothetical protein
LCLSTQVCIASEIITPLRTGDDRQEYFDHETLKKFADISGLTVQLQLTDAEGEKIVLFVDTTAPRR